jgi:hypothetical protein
VRAGKPHNIIYEDAHEKAEMRAHTAHGHIHHPMHCATEAAKMHVEHHGQKMSLGPEAFQIGAGFSFDVQAGLFCVCLRV